MPPRLPSKYAIIPAVPREKIAGPADGVFPCKFEKELFDMDSNTKTGCLAGCLLSVAIFAAAVLTVVTFFALAVGSCASRAPWEEADAALQANPLFATPLDESPFRKVCLSATDAAASAQVIRIDIHGVISDEPRPAFALGGERDTSAATALRKIRAATKDEDVRGLYLDIDSPGGGVTMSDELHDAICRFRDSDTNRFVFVHMGDMCCSGGYYVAAPATRIMARPTTITGSIGVIMSGVNASELAKKIGLAPVTIASGDNKSLLNPLEPVNPEHVKILEKPVKQMYERFVGIVAKGRGLEPEKVREIADGRILSADDALECGLVDAIGHYDDARAALKELAGEEVRIMAYRAKAGFWSIFEDSIMLESSDDLVRRLQSAVDGEATPRAEYRFR